MNIDRGLISGSTNLLLLSLFSESDMYGYEIIKELEDRSEKIFSFKEGTLYPILHKMENDGLIESYMAEGDTKRKRKYYRITKKGKRELVKEQEKWEVFTNSVNYIIGGVSYGV